MKYILSLCAIIAAIVLFSNSNTSDDVDNTLVWGDQLPRSLDPHSNYGNPMQVYLLNVYDGLYRYRNNPPELVPWLAKDHSVSDDGLQWDFQLREGVTFHDGSEVTASDVVYSFKRVLAIRLMPSDAFIDILSPENIVELDKYTVRFKLNKPYAPFLAAIPIVTIVNSQLLKANESDDDWGAKWLSSHAAGSGAYRIDPQSYRPQQALDLFRNEAHFMGWEHNPAPIDRVKARSLAETSTRVLALIKGDIDATDNYLPTDQVERVINAAGVSVARNESMRLFLIRMNNKRPPFDNVHTRRCFSYAFNYTGFIRDVLKDYAERNPAPVPKNLWGYPEDIQGYEFDLEKAQAECDIARAEGAPLDREIELHVQTGLGQTTQAAQLLQSDLRRIGINIRYIASTWPHLTSMMQKSETTPDMWAHWVSTYFIDPENWVGQMYDSQFHGGWKSSSWYENDKVNELLAAARVSLVQSERAELYKEATRLVVEDAADIWIYNTIELRGMNDRIKGYTFSPVGAGSELRYMYLAD